MVASLERAFRDEWGHVLAALTGVLGDLDPAEDAPQEAFAIAAERWSRDGAPANPRARLVTTARNRAIDRIRRDLPTRTARSGTRGRSSGGRRVLERALALRGRGSLPRAGGDRIAARRRAARLGTDRRPLRRACPPHRLAGRRVEPGRRRGRGDGPETALAIVARLALEDPRYLHATRGELLRRLGRADEARHAYRRALALIHDDAERRLLERRLAELRV